MPLNFTPCGPDRDEPIFIPCKDTDGRLHVLGSAQARTAACGAPIAVVCRAGMTVTAVCDDGCAEVVINLDKAVTNQKLRSHKRFGERTLTPNRGS